jgi:hypothetical protein
MIKKMLCRLLILISVIAVSSVPFLVYLLPFMGFTPLDQTGSLGQLLNVYVSLIVFATISYMLLTGWKLFTSARFTDRDKALTITYFIVTLMVYTVVMIILNFDAFLAWLDKVKLFLALCCS